MDKDEALKLLSSTAELPQTGTNQSQQSPALDQPASSANPTTDIPAQPVATLAPIPIQRPTLTPRTDQALRDALASSRIGPLARAEKQRQEKYIAQNKEPGVPLDIETGVSPWEKFVLGFHRERENQLKYLQNKYGEENVRLDTQGGLIARVMDAETGKAKDLKVDEWNMSAKDLLSLAGSVPEVAAGVIATLKARQLPKVGALKGILGLQRDIAATAVGAETAGAAKDVASSIETQGPSGIGDIPKIAKERAAMGVADVAIGEATMGAGRIFNFMKAPLAGSRGPVQFDALSAQKYFKEKYGIDVPLSIGESTGSPLFSRTEAFMEKLPGGGTPFHELKATQEENLRKLQNIMMGQVPEQVDDYTKYQALTKSMKGKSLDEAQAIAKEVETIKNKYGGKPPPKPSLPSDEAIGQDVIDALMKKIAPAEESVASSAKTISKVGTKQIENIVAGVTLPERQLFQSETGKEIRNAIVAKRDAAKAEADTLYAAVRAAPGGEGKVFDVQPLKTRFQEILNQLPSPQTTTEVASPIVGPSGEPLLQTETGQKVLKEFVPPNVLARLKSITEMEGGQFSLSDLQQMRREVYDDIAKGEGVPGLGTHYLNDIGKAITGAIDEGIAQLPEGDLRTALNAANKHYKEKVIPFNRVGLTELFRNPDEPGHISDSEVISRVFSGGKATERYGLMKETLGETSPEFSKLKRSLADRLIESSRLEGDSIIDPTKLIRNLNQLRTETPEIAKDIFGGKINEMFRQAKFLEYAKNSKVDAGELQSLLRDKSPTVKAFKALVDAEKQRDELYKNEILKDISSGSFGKTPLNPVEFTNRFLDEAKPSDISQVMYMIRGDKPLVDDLRAKTVEKIFRNASRSATPGDIGKLMSEDPTRIVSGTSVFKQIEAPGTRAKIRTILGPEIFRDLEQYIAVEAAGEAKETSFRAAGGLAAGMQIANLTRRGPLRYLYEAGKDFIVASLLTKQPIREWLSRVPASTDPQALSLILSSPPFLEAVAKEFPGAKGSMFMSAVKSSVDKWMKIKQQAPPADAVDQSIEAKRKAAEDRLAVPYEPNKTNI